ncbi:MAG: hypothetical protein RIT10_74 [Bacteroidota bacterium]|jgi:hypothetical protein
MTNLNTLETTLKAIEYAINALKNGQLTEEELAQFVEDSKELYEKAIVLRYKAYEEKVFGTSKQATQIEENSPAITEDLAIETAPEVEEVAPSFEFGLFDTLNETEEEPTLVVEEELAEENEMDFEQATIFESDASAIEIPVSELPIELELEVNAPLVETVEATQEEVQIEEEDDFIPQQFIQDEIEEDEPVVEEYSTEPYLKTVDSNESNADTSLLASQITALSMRAASHAGMMKLETLIGSFGLNERLQYINELFDGSSEGFSEAIKAIDHSVDLQQAIDKIAGFAAQNQWDLESETVEDFIVKVKRRYA